MTRSVKKRTIRLRKAAQENWRARADAAGVIKTWARKLANISWNGWLHFWRTQRPRFYWGESQRGMVDIVSESFLQTRKFHRHGGKMQKISISARRAEIMRIFPPWRWNLRVWEKLSRDDVQPFLADFHLNKIAAVCVRQKWSQPFQEIFASCVPRLNYLPLRRVSCPQFSWAAFRKRMVLFLTDRVMWFLFCFSECLS